MNPGRASSLQDLRQAADIIERCGREPPEEAKQAFRSALVRVVKVRNARLGEGGEQLQRLNALLSLMASIEFPLAGFHRERQAAVVREIRALCEAEPSEAG